MEQQNGLVICHLIHVNAVEIEMHTCMLVYMCLYTCVCIVTSTCTTMIQVNGKISNFKVEYRAGTKGKLTRSRLLVHAIYATHNNSHPK